MEKKQNYVTWIQTEDIKTEDIYSDIAKVVKIRFTASNYELDRPLPKEKHEKVIELVTD